MQTHTQEGVIAPFKPIAPNFIPDNPDLLEWDGLSPEEIECSDPLADMSEEERAEYERELKEQRDWERAELRAADAEAADARQGKRENILREFGTPENYFHCVGSTGDEDEIARLFGLGKAFMEPQNIARRANYRGITFQKATKAHRLLAHTAPAQSVAQTNPAPRQKEQLTPEQQECVDRAKVKQAAQKIVRTFYAEAIESHPKREKKLNASLVFQLDAYELSVAKYKANGKSEAEAIELWQSAARRAMEAKIA